LSVDPDVAETGEPYAFTGDDPLNATDPLGLMVNGGPGEPIAGMSSSTAVAANKLDAKDSINGQIDNDAAYMAENGSGPISPLMVVTALGLFVPGLDDGPDEAALAAEEAAARAADIARAAAEEGAAENAALDLDNLSPKIVRQMEQRGWTSEQIQDAFDKGEPVNAVNKATGGAATRYINPDTGQSVVIDNATGQVIQVGGPGFRFGPGSGDVP
jgi:hypothetical protein